MTNRVGSDIGRYHIVEQLGQGGMATVYKAFDTRLDRNVAIKIINASEKNSDTFLKRFEREAKALAQLSHPNIVKVYDYGDEDGAPYLVMEFLKGGTLKNRMGQPYSIAEAVRLTLPMARALAFAHERKIVHRDVKPANILITESGEPMLSDFGIAKILESEDQVALTGTGVGIGTPEYMAPEQGQGIGVDHRADIYALGIVFYELVTGRKPFQADTPIAVVLKHLSDPLPSPRQFVPSIPEEVERVIYKALAKNTADRYQSMDEFSNALERLLVLSGINNKPVPVSAPSNSLTSVQTRVDPVSAAPAARPVSPPSGQTPQPLVTPAYTQTGASQPPFFEPTYGSKKTTKTQKNISGWVIGCGIAAILGLCALLGFGAIALYPTLINPSTTASKTPIMVNQTKATKTPFNLANLPTIPVESQNQITTTPQNDAQGASWYIPSLKANVINLKFFESGIDPPERDAREYKTRFKASDARYISWEMNLEHPEQGSNVDFSVREEYVAIDVAVCDSDPSSYAMCTSQGGTTTYTMESNWTSSWWSWSYGWEETNKWEPGTYRVNIFVEDEKVATGTFEIYE